MILDPSAFNTFLEGMGQDVAWRRSHACPCLNPASGAAALRCVHCGGKGRLWEAPVDARFGTAGQDVQKTWANFGMYESGDQVVIVPSDSPAYGIGPFDRVLSKNRTEPFSMNLTRGVNESIQFPVESIEKVLFLEGEDLLEAPIPRVLRSGALDWGRDGPPLTPADPVPPGVPPLQTTYSVTGRRFSEWYVFQNSTFDRPHHAGRSLPRRVVLRRFDLYSRG